MSTNFESHTKPSKSWANHGALRFSVLLAPKYVSMVRASQFHLNSMCMKSNEHEDSFAVLVRQEAATNAFPSRTALLSLITNLKHVGALPPRSSEETELQPVPESSSPESVDLQELHFDDLPESKTCWNDLASSKSGSTPAAKSSLQSLQAEEKC